jgi:hypothetical protein
MNVKNNPIAHIQRSKTLICRQQMMKPQKTDLRLFLVEFGHAHLQQRHILRLRANGGRRRVQLALKIGLELEQVGYLRGRRAAGCNEGVNSVSDY